jgi:hypothetical protein
MYMFSTYNLPNTRWRTIYLAQAFGCGVQALLRVVVRGQRSTQAFS